MNKIPIIEKPVLNEHPAFKGFYKHPKHYVWVSRNDDNVVSSEGELIESASGGEYKSHKKFHLHRLKLETFKPPSITGIKLVGNHIDGDKHNNQIDNLEWVTYSDNIQHAFDSGLRSDLKHGYVLDLYENKIYVFNKLKDAANYMNVHPSKIIRWLKSKKKYPFMWKYSIWYHGDTKPELTDKDVCKCARTTTKPFKLKNNLTGEITTFVYNSETAKFLGVDPRKITKLRDEGKYLNYEALEINDPNEIIKIIENDDYVKHINENKHQSKQKKKLLEENSLVTIINEITGVKNVYNNLYDFSIKNNLNYSSVKEAFKNNDVFKIYRKIDD